MGQVLVPQYVNFVDGVVTAVEPDTLPKTASPRGRNSILVSLGAGRAAVAKRKGVTTQNVTPITGSPSIIGMNEYRRVSAGSYTIYHLLVSSGGRLDKLNSDTTTSPADAGTPTPFSAGASLVPDFTTASNLCFICNGSENKKFNGTLVQNWGIVRPAAAPTTAIGAAGVPNGSYECRYTYYNSATGCESSASDSGTIRALVNQKLNVTWTAPPDSQVDNIRIYVRNTNTQFNFYLAATIPIATATPYAADWGPDSNLIVVAPSTIENDPPPTFSVSEFHQQRMFGAGPANGSFLYYSKLGLPENFSALTYEPINQDNGSAITGLHSAHQLLIIFKRNSTWVLVGDDPTSWTVRLVDPTIGCVSQRSIITIEGITYWWSDQGPASWDGGDSAAKLVGTPLIAPTISADALNPATWDKTVAAVDYLNQHLLFAVPSTGSSRNDVILPWNYRLSRWASDGWTILDAASLATVSDTNNHPYVYLGSYSGQVFKFDNVALRDGVLSGTATGTVTSATSSTLTDSTASFLNTGGKNIDRYVTAIGSDGLMQRRRITASTATQLTVSPDWVATPNTTYTYIIGGIDFQWDFPEEDFNLPFLKKRLEFFYLQAKTTDNAVTVSIDFFKDRLTEAVKTVTVTLTGGAAIYDSAIYDSAVYGGASTMVSARKRVGKTCRTMKARVRCLQDNVGVTILKAGWRAESQTDKLGFG